MHHSLRWFADCTGWQRVVLFLWVALLLGVCVRSALMPQRQSLWPTFGAAGQRWLHGEELYIPPGPGQDLFRYSPCAAALFAPLALLPEALANPIWRLLNVLVFFAGLVWWCRVVPSCTWTRQRSALLLLLLGPFVLPSLNNGQVNLLLTGLLLLGSAAVVTNRWPLAGGCLALACLLKVYPLALALLLCLLRPRQLGPALLLALLLWLGLPFLMQAPEYVAGQYADWWRHLLHGDRPRETPQAWLSDLRLLFLVAGTPLAPATWLMLQGGAGLLMASLCLLTRWRGWDEREQVHLATALGCCWMTVFGPATESCTWIVLAPVLLVAVVRVWGRIPILPCSQAGLESCPTNRLRWLLLVSLGLFILPLPLKWFTAERWPALMWLPTAGGVLYTITVGWGMCSRLAEPATEETNTTGPCEQFSRSRSAARGVHVKKTVLVSRCTRASSASAPRAPQSGCG